MDDSGRDDDRGGPDRTQIFRAGARRPRCFGRQRPLLYLFAGQLLQAGGNLVAVLDTTPRSNWTKALPFLPPFLVSPYLLKGLALLAKVRRSVPVFTRVGTIEVIGQDRATAIRFQAKGRTEEIDIDSVFLHQESSRTTAWPTRPDVFLPGMTVRSVFSQTLVHAVDPHCRRSTSPVTAAA